MAEAKAGEYVALVDLTMLKDNKRIKPGETVKLTAEQAAILVAKSAVKAK
jgi:hypothetical protein